VRPVHFFWSAIMIPSAARAVCNRLGWLALGVIVGLLSATGVSSQAPQPASQAPAPPVPPAQQAQTTPATRLFTSDAGLVLNFIKADRTKDFEAVIAKLKGVMEKSEKPERRAQAKGWRVFKATDPAAGGNTLYVFINEPPVKGADYTVSTIMTEALPASETADVLKQYADVYAAPQNWVNLKLVSDLGQ
jgi:hypothetical protein